MPLSQLVPGFVARFAQPFHLLASTDASPHASTTGTPPSETILPITPGRITLFTAISILLLVPCFWQQRIQSADLSSHIYNVWLAQLVRDGNAPGLWLAPQTNNFLFDLLLDSLSRHFGFGLAQRIAASLIVLLLAWGSVFFIFRLTHRAPLFLLPCFAILVYGVLYHAGFFNFYLSLGVCFWYLGFFWNASWHTRLLLTALLIPAWLAHPFPVLWAAGCALYVAVMQAIPSRFRLTLLLLAIAFLLAIPAFLPYRFEWHPSQIFLITGANIAIVYGAKYVWVMAALLLLWISRLVRIAGAHSWSSALSTPQGHLWILTAAAVFVLPNAILFPQYAVPFQFIAVRLSFCSAILLLSLIVFPPANRLDKALLAFTAVLFFSLLYFDEAKLNRRETQVADAVQTLPKDQRVISSLPRVFHSNDHILDRACLGHCFSYANYEPSSLQFRVRARPGNPIVLDSAIDVGAATRGTYVVQPRDLPLYNLVFCDSSQKRICVRATRPGDMVGPPR